MATAFLATTWLLIVFVMRSPKKAAPAPSQTAGEPTPTTTLVAAE